jgi:prephenate dehydrogenase
MKLAIIGLGAIGGSFAMALQHANYSSILGVDIDEQTILEAKKQGIIQQGSSDPKSILPEADMVLLSLYPSQLAPFVRDYREYFKPHAILTDVSGIKKSLITQVKEYLREDLDFIFAHPMRGSEKKGFVGADASRFKNANALITPTTWNKEENIQKVEQLYRDSGFTTLTRVIPDEHDEQIAYVSQLIHALAVAVVNSPQATEKTPLFAGGSFKELTRIADINADLWSELFMNNREDLIQSIQLFEKELNTLKNALVEKDEERLKELFQRSSNQQQHWFN